MDLSILDEVFGDGDHGVTMETGWRAMAAASAKLPPDASLARMCHAAADAFLDAAGASAGPLSATAFARAGDTIAHRHDLDPLHTTLRIDAVAQGIGERGDASEGDKTMLDALIPAARAAFKAGAAEASIPAAAARAAAQGRDATALLLARRGRAAKLGERARGHMDPGAASTALLREAWASEIAQG